jgi:dipeptidyl aminopeptidase/acylaminoacyl peptidase
VIANKMRRQAVALMAWTCTVPGWAADGAAAPPVGAAPAPGGTPARLPLEHFARLPLISEITLSPDGERFAALMNHGDDTLIVVRELQGSSTLRPVLKTDNREFRFSWMRWVNDERLLVSVAFPSRYGWTEIGETRLFTIKRDGSGLVNIVRRSAFATSDWFVQFQDQVIDWLPGDGKHVLMQLADESSTDPAVYRVNVETGRRVAVQGARAHVQRWLTDAQHRVRVGVRQKGTAVQILVRDPDGDEWRTAWSFDAYGADAVWPLGFGPDPQLLYVRAYHEGRLAVFETDLREASLPRRLLLSDARQDIGGTLLHDSKTGAAIGISGDGSTRFWQPEAQTLLQAIARALPLQSNRLLEFSRDGSRYLLYSVGNGMPGNFLVGFRTKGELTPLAETYPQLLDRPLARKESLLIRARDGAALPALLTLPPGAARTGRLATVLMRLDDPLAINGTAFDPLVLFLADRGYAVLQVSARGTLGLGAVHPDASLKRWGQDTQDDLADALQWLVDRGTADAARVCIAGGGEGGFAALTAVTQTPRRYRCAVSFAGISDLVELGRRQRRFVNGQAVFERLVGSLWDDSDRLKAASPRRLAGQVEVPVLLVHGTADRNVPVTQSEGMADALKQAGKAHKFIKLDDGDHHLNHQAHRTQFFQELEAFLDTHIGPTAAGARTPVSASR